MAIADDEINVEAVRLTAYFLWEQEGRPDGRASHFWYRAWGIHRRAHRNGRLIEAGLESQVNADEEEI
jgi:hypothetical protein